MTKIIILTALLVSFICFSQDSIPYRDIITINKNKIVNEVLFPVKKTISTDSLIINKQVLNFNKDLFLKDSFLINRYKFHAFGYKPDRYLYQWNCPINIYFDKLIPKNIINDFTDYINGFNSIPNLKISITTNIEDANYYFKVYEADISAYSKEVLNSLNNEESKTKLYTKITYDLNQNKNKKYYNGILKISKSELSNKYLSSKLKIIFYLSLTHFYRSDKAEKNSILNKETILVDELSDYDIILLKSHYNQIYPVKINYKNFINLLK
ncbi:hypothetical protein [Aurantibacter sp.]|uniref:hypothetical protein n=1 Tax=Aurantibacter sp. TaxID=2807103 RepID=UPI0035C7ADC5